MRVNLMRALMLVVFSVALLLMASCTLPRYEFQTVKLALVAPFSGSSHREAGRWHVAAQIAVEIWNRENADRPYRIELVASDENEGLAVARRQVIDSDILAVLGYSSTAPDVRPQREEYARAGVILVPLTDVPPCCEGERVLPRSTLSAVSDAGQEFADEFRRRWGEAATLPAATVYIDTRRLLDAYAVVMDQRFTPTRDRVWQVLQAR